MPELETSEKKIEHILKHTKTIALVGASYREELAAHYVMKYLQEQGYKVFPVNPKYKNETLLGEKVYGDLTEIKKPIDMVDVFRPSKEALEITKKSVEINAKFIWLQLGIVCLESKQFAEKNNKVFIQDHCSLVEHKRLFS